MSIKPNQPLQVGEWLYLPEQDKLVKFDGQGNISEMAELDNLCQKVTNYFIVNAGKLVTKDELLLDVWGIRDVSDGRVTRVIRVLRVALGDDTRDPKYIETIPKRGYRFIAPVIEHSIPETSNDKTDQATQVLPAAESNNRKYHYVALWAAAVFAVLIVWWQMLPQSTTAPDAVPMWRYKPVTALDGLEFYHNLSADGRYLVFSHASPAAENITVLMLQDLQQHKQLQLTDLSFSSFGAAFSPDNSRIAYQRMYTDGHCEIRMIELNLTQFTEVSDNLLVPCGDKTVSARVSWSPDGRYLVYPSMDSGQKQMVLQLLAVDSKVPEQLTVPPASSFGDYAARFSRAGDKLVFLRDASGSAQIWLLDLSSRATKLLVQVRDTYPGNVDWNLNDTAIIYPSGPTALSRVDINTLQTTVLAYTDNYANELQVSKDGRLLASVGNFSRMNVKKVANQITNAEPYNEPVFSSNRNESFVEANPIAGGPSAVVSRRSGLPQVWLFYEDGRQQQITFFEKNERFRHIAFSPDGTRLLVQLTNEIWLISESEKPLQIAGGDGAIVGTPSWSKAGERIFYAESHQGRWEIISTTLTDLSHKENVAADRELYLESRDADYVVWRDSVSRKFYLQRPDTAPQLLPIELPDTQLMLKLALRNGGIYYSFLIGDMEYQLKYFDFATGQSRVAINSMQLGRFSLSADERYVFLLEYEFGDIDIAEVSPDIEIL